MKFINKKAKFPISDANCISDCMQFIEAGLEESKADPKLAIKTQLLAEEMIISLIENNDSKGGDVRIHISKFFGNTGITISVKGREFDLFGNGRDLADDIDDLGADEAQDVIRSIILRSHGEDLKYGHKKGINSVRIMTGHQGMSFTKLTIIALAAGLLFGLILKTAVPETGSEIICSYVLGPVRDIFMNALKIVIAPMVFFSIVTCLSGFSDITELGKIGIRVMGMYLFTTVIAVFMSYGVTKLIDPGTFGAGLALSGGQPVDVDTSVDTSLLNTIINIIPSNFLRPFLESDTLQLIFLAVMIGIAVGRIGKYTPVLTEIFEGLNSLFLTITSIIAKFIPVAVFCSVSLMMVQLGGSSFLSVLGYALANIIEIFIMMMIYGLLVGCMAKLNPLVFFKNIKESMLTSFTLSSSSAAMPTNIRTCTDKLGISPKVCNFSIPLGATINMDGTCIGLVLSGLFLAKMYGISVPNTMIGPLAITIILLSLGCPGVPGAGLVCTGIILQQLGVPIEAMGLIIAIDPLLDMFDTMSNTTGDIACATITAAKEGLLDKEIYYDMSNN
ncbi:MAG: dicarboxylate/amino acid:cation symporter [Mogibacterium sp.]|nr:dicarboxylate/amino acid:cation symporter [Mogibacterium sp.]